MPTSTRDDPHGELADLVLNVARLVRSQTPAGAEAVPLTATERHVMRVVDLHPGSAPSRIAAYTRLQRTNVSTALRGLEAKGMLTRTRGAGRGVEVHPTALASSNLERLRSVWSQQVAAALPDDEDAVRRCADLLGRLEAGLLGDA